LPGAVWSAHRRLPAGCFAVSAISSITPSVGTGVAKLSVAVNVNFAHPVEGEGWGKLVLVAAGLAHGPGLRGRPSHHFIA
jgi:hypothetical protein